MKIPFRFILLLISGLVSFRLSFASDTVPLGNTNNMLYYKIGGGDNYVLPPLQDTKSINLGASSDLGSGYSCGAFNPLVSIKNTFNNLKNSADNIQNSVIQNVTGSIAEIPMYAIAQADPDLYNLLNNTLLGAHQQLDVTTKACQTVKQEIGQGKNPYKDWAMLAVGNQWKKHLSLTADGEEDVNEAKTQIETHPGDDGVPWVQGNKTSDGTYAGGVGQPSIHVIADTTQAGYNALLNHDLNSNDPAPANTQLATDFATPQEAQAWITNVVGDQVVTTCTTDPSCQKAQAGTAGRGLLPWITTCTSSTQSDCVDNIRTHLTDLVTGAAPLTKENLNAVSASGVMISPEVITAIRSMDKTQQGIVVNKLAQEAATQRIMDKAFIARNILQTGAQVPVIAANHPAQTVIQQSINALDKDIQSLSFESQIRKQMMSNTLSEVLAMQQSNQQSAIAMPKTTSAQPFINNGAANSGGKG